MQATEPVDPGPGTFPLGDEDRTLLPKVELELEVREGGPEGPVRERKTFAANLATENLVDVMRTLYEGQEWSQYTTNGVSLTDRDGNGRGVNIFGQQYVAGDDDSSDWIFCSSQYSDHLHEIAVGDGGGSTVTPQRDGNDLTNRLGSAQIDEPASLGDDAFAISATIVNTSGAAWTVREVGFYHEWAYGNEYDHGTAHFLTLWDAVSSVNVPDGDAVSVQYTMRWP